MSRMAWGGIGLAIIIIGLGAWWLSPIPLTPNQRFAREVFTRPTSLTERSVEFSIRINDVDGIGKVPSVECNAKAIIEVAISGLGSSEIETLTIVPRLPEQGEDGFAWMDARGCDLHSALSPSAPSPKNHAQQHREKFNLRAGEYVVRYYLQSMNISRDDGELPRTELLGEGRLVVAPPQSNETDCGLIPLSNKANLIPMGIPSNERSL